MLIKVLIAVTVLMSCLNVVANDFSYCMQGESLCSFKRLSSFYKHIFLLRKSMDEVSLKNTSQISTSSAVACSHQSSAGRIIVPRLEYRQSSGPMTFVS